MRANRKSTKSSGVSVLTFEGVNASGITSGNSGILWCSATDITVEIEAKNASGDVIFLFSERNTNCGGLRRDPGPTNIQIEHDFGEVSDSSSITITFHDPSTITSLQIWSDINISNWVVNSIEDVNKMIRLETFICIYKISMVPDLLRMEALQTINIQGTDENEVDVRYSNLKSLTSLSIGPTWLNNVSNNMDVINKLTNLNSLAVYQNVYKQLSGTQDYLLNFTQESEILNIQSFGFNQIGGFHQSFPDRLKHLVNLTAFSVSEKSNQASYSFDMRFPLLDGQPNTLIDTISLFGLWGTNCNITHFPNIEDLPSLTDVRLTYMIGTTAGATLTMDVFYIWFFTKVWNPAVGHIHHNGSIAPETYIHANFRELYLQPRFIPKSYWNRDKYQEISRVNGFSLSANNLIPPTVSYTPISTDWSNVLNSDIATSGEITKTSGGNAHGNGGGFIDRLGEWNDITINAIPSSGSGFMHIGLVDDALSTIDILQIKYGLYFRDSDNIQAIKDGNVVFSTTLVNYNTYNWYVKREDGKVTIGYDTTEIYIFENIDTTEVFDLEPLKVMVSIYTQGEGFNTITQLN